MFLSSTEPVPPQGPTHSGCPAAPAARVVGGSQLCLLCGDAWQWERPFLPVPPLSSQVGQLLSVKMVMKTGGWPISFPKPSGFATVQ